jgi:hypothetical protein
MMLTYLISNLLTSRDLEDRVRGRVRKESRVMFQMYPEALEAEVARRHELVLAAMRAAHGTSIVVRRVSGMGRVRYVVVSLVTALAASASA